MWRQRSADAGRNTLKYQLADVAQGLSFEHYPYNVIVDKVSCIVMQFKECSCCMPNPSKSPLLANSIFVQGGAVGLHECHHLHDTGGPRAR